MASADFSFALTKELSPGKVLFLSLHTVRLYLARLDGLWASLRPASLPPVRGLSADSCSYGQRFVPRFLQLGRAACAPRLPPCGSLRLPPSVPVSTLQLTRNSPCWAHWRTLPACRAETRSALVPGPAIRLTPCSTRLTNDSPLGPSPSRPSLGCFRCTLSRGPSPCHPVSNGHRTSRCQKAGPPAPADCWPCAQ